MNNDDNFWDIYSPQKGSSKKQDLLDKMRGSTSSQESNGDTKIINRDSGAMGEFQVMPFNVRPWTKKYYGKELSEAEFRNNPAAQRIVFNGEMGSYLDGALKIAKNDEEAVRMAATRWYGGRYDQYDDPTPQFSNGKQYPSRREYTTSIANRIFGTNLQKRTKSNDQESFWDSFQPTEESSNSDLSFWDVQSEGPKNLNKESVPQSFSSEPDMNYMQSNGLIAENTAQALLNHRSRVQEELQRAKTPARKKILQQRLFDINKQIKEGAKQIAANSGFQAYGDHKADSQLAKKAESSDLASLNSDVPQNETDIQERYNRFLELTNQKDSPETQKEFESVLLTQNEEFLVPNSDRTGLKENETNFKQFGYDKTGEVRQLEKVLTKDKDGSYYETSEDVAEIPNWITATSKPVTELPSDEKFREAYNLQIKNYGLTDSEELRIKALDSFQNKKPIFDENELNYLELNKENPNQVNQPQRFSRANQPKEIQEPQRTISSDGFTANVNPDDTEIGGDKNETVYRQAAKQLGRKIYNRDLDELEVEALTQKQKREKGGFVFSTETNKPIEGVEGEYTFSGENVTDAKKYLDEIQPELQKQRDYALAYAIESTLDLSNEERQKLNELGWTNEAIDRAYTDDPRFEQSRSQREKNKAFYDSRFKNYSENSSPRLAQIQALRDIGVVSQEKVNSEIKLEDEAKSRLKENLQNPSWYQNLWNKSSEGLTLLVDYINPVNAIDDWQKNIPHQFKTISDPEIKKRREKALLDNIRGIEQEFSSVIEFEKFMKLNEGEEYNIGRQAKYFGKNMLKLVAEVPKTLEVLDSLNEDLNPLGLVIPKDYVPSLRSAGNVISSIGDYLTGKETPFIGADATVEQRQLYSLGKNFQEWLGDDQYLKRTFSGELNNGLASGVAFLLGGYAMKGSKYGAAILGVLTQVGGTYDQLREKGVAPEEAKRWAAAIGIPLGYSEKWGIGGQPERMLAKLGSELDENAIKTLAKSFVTFGKSVGKDIKHEFVEEFFQEWGQSTFSEAAINAIAAKDKSSAEKIKLFLQEIPRQAVANVPQGVLGGISGGVLGGATSVAFNTANRIQTKQSNNQEVDSDVVETEELGLVSPEPKINETTKSSEPVQNPKVLQKVEIKGKGEGVIVEDKGDKVLVDYNDGNSRTLVRKNQVTPIVEENPEIDVDIVQSQPKVNEKDSSNEVEKSALTPKKQVVQGIQLTPRQTATVSNATEIAKEVGAVTSKKDEKEFTQDLAEATKDKEGSELSQAVHSVIEDFKPDEDKSPRKVSSTQVDFPEAEANQMRSFGKRLIKDEDLHEKGREERPHFTTKFGLTTKDAERVRPLVENIKHFKVKLGKTFIFENENFDVVNVGIENSPELEALNKILGENLRNSDTHPEYVPHAALAYVKKGEGKKYLDNSEMEGKEVEFNGLTFSGKDRQETFISFGGKEDVAKVETDNKVVPESQSLSIDNEFGGKTSVKIKVNENGKDFTIETTVRKPEKNGTTRLQNKSKTFPIEQYTDFIEDLEKRGGNVKGKNYAHLFNDFENWVKTDSLGKDKFLRLELKIKSKNFTDEEIRKDIDFLAQRFARKNNVEEANLAEKLFKEFNQKAKSLQKTENAVKTESEVKTDVKPSDSLGNDNRSNEGQKSDVVQRPESIGRTDGVRQSESGNGNGRISGTTQSSSRKNSSSSESELTRTDSISNDVEQSSERSNNQSNDRVSEPRGNDYVAPLNSLSRQGSWRETAKRNLDIIELVKNLEAENRLATPEEQSLLVKFTGWGASEIANNLFPGYQYYNEIRPQIAKDGWKDLAQRAKDLFTADELKTAARSTRNAHYTSESIVRGIWDAVQRFGFSNGKVLEPGMGVGLFGVAAPESIFKNSKYTGIERDSMTARIAKQILQNQAVLENDFVKQNLPDNFFDVAIGNPPFSDTRILNDPRYKKYRFMTHDYFFAKSIDKVRPGGILVFVTSKGTMDKTDPKMREYIQERADLLGAIRLPQTAFKENAGTEVVTDVLFFRKRAEWETSIGQNWVNVDEITANNKQGEEHKGLINEYFINHPEMVLGSHSFQGSMYRGNEYTVIPNEGNIDEQFQKAIENLPSAVYANIAKSDEIVQKTLERDWNPKEKKEGSLYIHEDGRLMRKEFGAGVELIEVSKNEEKFLRSYVGLRTALKTAQSEQLTDNPDWQKSLDELNRVYDDFVQKHGRILEFSIFERTVTKDDGTEVTNVYRRFKNNKVLNFDVESPLVEALESVTEDGSISKSPMLLGRTIKPPIAPEIRELSDALAVSLDSLGKLNLSHVTELYQTVHPEITRDEVVKELGDAVFETPSGEYQLADEYLSGFVIDKLEEAQLAATADKRFQRNVEALLKVQPAQLESVDISPVLGAAWIGPKHTSEFAREVLGLRTNAVSFEKLTNTWTVDGADGRGARSLRDASNEWGTSDRSPNELLDAVLNNRTVKITYRDSEGKTHTDADSTALANEKIKLMKEAFRRWIWKDAKRSQEITEKYNQQFNNIAPRFFDGSHLTTPGLSSRYKLHPHQKRAVWRVLQTGNTYLAHAVGAGKTLEMIVSGMEQKRLGLISKPMYVVPNHMLKQFSSEFLEAYPLANILVADEKNFAKEKRQKFTAQAALNDLDAVIITHSAFGLIRTKSETADVVIDEMVDQMRMMIEELDSTDQTEKRTIKDLENRIEKIEQKFGSLADATGKDDVINFEDLGVDFVYVDEAHEFRKLDFVTNRTNVKGIDPKGSQRSLDLLIKLRWLNSQHPGRSAVLASGTPITNTMAELYSIMRYLDNQELETAEISHFDAWSSQFGEVVADYEMNAAGNYEIVERFAKFVNIPELMKRVRKFMDVLTLNQLGSLINLPTIKGGSPEIVVVPATSDQQEYLKTHLASRIETSRKWKPSKDQPGNPDPLINIITDGRLAAIDMRFVNPKAVNDPNSKLNVMIDSIINKYNETKDLEYRDKNNGETEGIKGAAQIVFSAVGFGEQVAIKRGFDAKHWMIKRLTESGIPLSEIAFMSDYKTASAKERMFREMRLGSKKILIGSPKNMGTGVNVQKRLKVLHYLSPPWYPSDVEQPDGRIIRQGNQNEEIEIYRYATKGTYDSTAWAMIARKSRAIEQAMTGDDSQRGLEDVSESSQYEMASAVSAGDDRAIKLAGLRRDIEKLERLKNAHFQEQRRLGYDKERSKREIKHQEEQISKFDKGLVALGKDFIPSEEFSVSIGNQKLDKRLEIGQAVKTNWQKFIKTNKGRAISSNNEVIGEIGKAIGKLPLQASVFASNNGVKSVLIVKVGDVNLNLVSDYNGIAEQDISDIDAVGLATRVHNALNSISKKKTESQTQVETEKRKIKQIDSKIGQPFAEDQELYEKIAEYAQLQSEMAGESTKNDFDFLQYLKENIASKAIQKVINRHLDNYSVFTEDEIAQYQYEPETLKSTLLSANEIEFDGISVPIHINNNLTGYASEIQDDAINYLNKNLPELVNEYFETFGKQNIGADNAKELFPQYNENRLKNDKSIQAAASALARLLFRKQLTDLPKGSLVQITAGGMGSGKSTAIANSNADLIYDSVMGNKEGNRRVIDAIAENEHFGRITFVYRPIENAVVGNMRRSLSQGRLVSEDNIIWGHFNSLNSFLDDTYEFANSKNFEIVILENIDNEGLKEISLEDLNKLRYTSVDEVRQRTNRAFEQEYQNGNYPESHRTEFRRLQRMVEERDRKDVESQDSSGSAANTTQKSDVDSQKQILSEYLQGDERQIFETLKDLPFVPFDDLLANANIERFGDKIKANPQSHEILRRAFEQARLESGQTKLGSKDIEDLFAGIFLKPETTAKTFDILQRKADEAQKLGYSAQEIEVLTNHANLLKDAAEIGNGTAIVYVFDQALPEEIFHQSDYLGAAEKSILSRHSVLFAQKLDANPITQKLWSNHFSRFNEYKRLSSKVLKAVLRAEIAPMLTEMSDSDLAKYGITEDERAEYLLTWFEGYAEKNGIDALDNFEREELNVQEFIEKIKETKQVRQDGQTNQKSSEKQNVKSGESRRGPPNSENKNRRLSAGTAALKAEKSDVAENVTFDSKNETILAKNEKFASLPATLRRAGIEADEVVYEVFGDKAAQNSAKKILDENGIEGSIQLLRNTKVPDVDHAILSFMIQRILLDKASDLSSSNPTDSESLRALALKLGREHALKAVSAGRFTRAASIVQNSVEGVMYAVQGVIQDKFGDEKTLSPSEWERIEAKARAGEKALAKIESLRKEKISLQRKIKRLEEEKDGKIRKRKSTTSMESRKKIVDLIKDRNGKRIEEIRKNLLEKLAPVGLKSIVGEKANLSPMMRNFLETAKELEKQGNNSNEIFFASGWERGADGNWKHDLPGKFNVKHSALRQLLLSGNVDALDSVLDAPELFAAYPQLRNIAVAFETMPRNDEAYFDATNQYIALSDDFKWTRALGLTFKRGGGLTFSLKHEVQHAIQHLEGFATGANSKKSTRDEYQRKAGEVEARNAEKRMEFSVAKLASTPISQSEDFLRKEQILDEPNTLKSTLNDEGGFDEQTLNDFAEVGAMFLIEGMAAESEYLPENFHAQMVETFGDAIGSDFQKIYEKSWDLRNKWLSEIRKERTNENIQKKYGEELEDWEIDDILGERKEASARKRAIETLHRVTAGKAKITPSEEKLSVKINDIAPNEEIAESARILSIGGTRQNVYDSLPEMAETAKEKIYQQAIEILSFAKKIQSEINESNNPIQQRIDKIRNEVKNSKKQGKEETAEAMRKLRQFNNLIDRLNKNVSTPKSKQISNIITEISKETDEKIMIAASLIGSGANIDDIYDSFGDSLTQKEQREVLRKAHLLFEEAKIELEKRQRLLLEKIADAKDELRSISDLQWQARQNSRQSALAIAKELERIKKGEYSYRLGQIVDIANASRTLMASFDLSASLRQGGFFTFAKPELQRSAFANMAKSFGEKGYGQVIQAIEANPLFTLAQRAGIDFAEAGRGDTDSEELYRGKQTLEKIPFFGSILNKSITGWSERTYTSFLDSQRMIIFESLAKDLLEQGLSFERNPNEFEKSAQFINVATGRGTQPSSQIGKLLLDLPFFAPRYTLSRFQLLNMTLNPVAYYRMPSATRKIIAKSAVRFYGTTTTILALPALLGLVGFDPDDDEFLKIKVGNTRYDIFAGTLQPAKAIIKFVNSAIKTKGGQDNRIPGEFWYDIADMDKGVIPRFIRGKLSPGASLAWDVLSGKTFTGEEFSWGKGILSRIVPLTFGEMYEAYKLDGVVGIGRSTPFSLMGIGVNNYKSRLEKPRTDAEKLATKATAMKLNSKAQTEEEKQQRERISEMTYRSRIGEDIDNEIQEMANQGLISKDDVKNILSAKNKSFLVDRAENLSFEDFTAVFEAANSNEREDLLPILNKKMKNADVDGKLSSEARNSLEKLGGKIIGYVPMPNDVKIEFERFGIATPDVGEMITLKKGERTKLNSDQLEKYRKEALERIYKRVEELINSDNYMDSNTMIQEKMLKKVIRKAREIELKETKSEIKRSEYQAF